LFNEQASQDAIRPENGRENPYPVQRLPLHRNLIVHMDGPIPLPIVAGMEVVNPWRKAAGAPGAPINAVQEARWGDDSHEICGVLGAK